MIHMLKAAVGVGILTMPDAIRRLGLVYGSIGIMAIGLFTVYCLHILVSTQVYNIFQALILCFMIGRDRNSVSWS